MFIDEFCIKVNARISKQRQQLANFLIWIVSKLDVNFIDKCLIGEKIEINMKHYVPQDGQWHYFAYTVDMWIKYKEIVKNKKICVDGKKIKLRKNKNV